MQNKDVITKPNEKESLSFIEKIKQESFSLYEKQDIPLKKNENWKYTKPKFFNETEFFRSQKSLSPVEKQEFIDIDAYEIVFDNGFYNKDKSNIEKNNDIEFYNIKTIGDNPPKWFLDNLNKNIDINTNTFACLNNANIEDFFAIKIKKDAKIDKPIHIIFANSNQTKNDIYTNYKGVVIVEKNASATIVESHAGKGQKAYFSNYTLDLFLKENSTLKHYKLQNEKKDSYHISYSAVEVEKNASYENFTLHKGAMLSRSEVLIDLCGENANCLCDGGYLTAKTRHSDITSKINHLHPNTTSDQMIKGVSTENSKSVYQGKIYVARDAQQVDGNQLHKGLLLSREAEIDCKPELEIYADDVKCTHGATIGELDEKQLFYLRTRGVSEQEARSLLIEAFLDDLLNRITEKQIKESFSKKIRSWLEDRRR